MHRSLRMRTAPDRRLSSKSYLSLLSIYEIQLIRPSVYTFEAALNDFIDPRHRNTSIRLEDPALCITERPLAGFTPRFILRSEICMLRPPVFLASTASTGETQYWQQI
jgi:hypothetical protein